LDEQIVQVGGLVPHVVFQVVSGAEHFSNLQLLPSTKPSEKLISSVDLPAQLATKQACPPHVFLYIITSPAEVVTTQLFESIRATIQSDTILAILFATKEEMKPLQLEHRNQPILQVRLTTSIVPALANCRALLIRPDGHIGDFWHHPTVDSNL